MKTYRVKGHALMPVEVVISVKARTPRAAMKAAEEFLNNAAVSKAIRNCIVDNSGDPAAVCDFEGRCLRTRSSHMTDAEELNYLRDAIQLERDESAKRLQAAHLWSVVRSLLIDAGCPIETSCHIPTVVAEWLESAYLKQPSCAKRLTSAGWRFEWQPEAGFVAAEHPLGGKQSVVRVSHVGRTGFDVNEIGQAIATMLNGGNRSGQHGHD